jgi:hypothetical protein
MSAICADEGPVVADERADWLAAYALGLVVAGNLDDAVADLVEQAGHDAEVLDVARGHLQQIDIGDAASRRRATDLLTEATAVARRTSPPPG